jgi:hypothetical protein
MTGTQRLSAVVMAFLSFSASAAPSALDAVGVVAQANHASLGSQSASEGTTVYDGDQLSTDAEGTLRLLIGQAVLHLVERSSVVVHGAGDGARHFDAQLLSGAAVLSVTTANPGEIVACSARVRSLSQERGVVRVQILGPRELVVYAQRGAAEISYRGETETVPEGKALRVLLDAQDEGQRGAVVKKPVKSRKMIWVTAIATGAAVGAAIAIALTGKQTAVESPDHP